MSEKVKETKKVAEKVTAKKPVKPKKNDKGQMLQVMQVRSVNGCIQSQIATVKGLGLRRIRHTVSVEDTPAVRGMINKVKHLVQIV